MEDFSLYTEDELSNKVIGVALDVHSQIGPSLLENVYKQVLYYKLMSRKWNQESEEWSLLKALDSSNKKSQPRRTQSSAKKKFKVIILKKIKD